MYGFDIYETRYYEVLTINKCQRQHGLVSNNIVLSQFLGARFDCIWQIWLTARPTGVGAISIFIGSCI